MAVALTPFLLTLPSISSSSHSRSFFVAPYSSKQHIRSITIKCVKVDTEETNIMCDPCNGKGWLVCDFCEGQKTNVKAPNNRIYRRCPSCKAVRYYYLIKKYYYYCLFICYNYCCRLDMCCVLTARSSNVSLFLISTILLLTN